MDVVQAHALWELREIVNYYVGGIGWKEIEHMLSRSSSGSSMSDINNNNNIE